MIVATAAQRGVIPPAIDPESAAWWEAVGRGVLTLPRCRANGHDFFPPAPACPYCGGVGYDLHEASGRGQIYSWVVTHRALDPRFKDDVPYTVLVVELEEGPRMFGRLVGPSTFEPSADDAVRAVFYEVAGQPLVGFAPEAPPASA